MTKTFDKEAFWDAIIVLGALFDRRTLTPEMMIRGDEFRVTFSNWHTKEAGPKTECSFCRSRKDVHDVVLDEVKIEDTSYVQYDIGSDEAQKVLKSLHLGRHFCPQCMEQYARTVYEAIIDDLPELDDCLGMD